MAQEMWLLFANESEKKVSSCQGNLVDVELYFDATTGIWGSLVFLTRARGSK
jgi:hypothetical protein